MHRQPIQPRPTVPVLDREYLATQTAGDPELTRIVLEAARDELPEARQRLSSPDIGVVGDTAHLLKGMLGMLGAARASTGAAELEAAARNHENVALLIPALVHELEQLAGAIDRLLSELP